MPRRSKTTLPGFQRFETFLADEAKAARESVGANIETVAGLVGRKGRTVERFENQETSPDDQERLIAAYAEVAGLGDAREIYRRAVEEWIQRGAAPQINPVDADTLTPAQHAVKRMREEREREERRAASQRKPTATRKRRATS